MRYFCATLVAVFLSFASFGIGTITGTTKLCQGTSYPLANITPGGTWSSSDLLIASIGSSSGIVTALYPGTAMITYTAGTAVATTTVTVNPTSIITGTMTVCAGSATILSNGIFGGTWASANTGVATVAPGISNVTVNGITAGSAKIIYTYPSGCQSSAVVIVNPLPARITGDTTVCVYETIQLKNTTPNGVWASSLPAVATIGLTSGVLKGESPGTVVVDYTPLSGCTRTVTITVNPLPAPITGVTHTFQGNKVTLSDATPGGLWSSSFPAFASVGSATGTVTGIKSGVVDIFYTLTSTGCRNLTHFVVNPFPDSAGIFPVVAWYPFCGNTLDRSGLSPANNLTMPVPRPPLAPYPSATLAPSRNLVPNSAYSFNGTTQLMQRSPIFSTATPVGDFTYACWIRPNGPQNSIAIYNGIPALNGFGFAVNNGTLGLPGLQVGVLFGGVGTQLYLSTITAPFAEPTYAINGWLHLMLVKEGNTFYFYINNISAGFFNTVTFSPPTGTFMVGYDRTGAGGMAFNGEIDDIAIFNTALNPIQRQELYMFNPDESPFTLGNDTTLCGDSITLTPNPQADARIYRWSTGDSTNRSIVVNPPPLTTTSYSLSISQPYGCTTTDVIDITKTPLTVNLGPDTNICTGDTIILRSTYPGATYSWSTGATADSIEAYSTGTYWVTVDSNVCTGHDSIFVNARKTPLVDLGPDVFNCTGSPATIRNIYQAYDAGMVYLWSNGSNLDSLVTTTSGSFWVQVTNNGCSRADSIKALIVYDTFSFFSTDTAICHGRYVTGNATYNPIVNYQWTPTTGVELSTVPSTNITPDTSATYVLTGRYAGCADRVFSFHIDVQPNPIVSLAGNKHVCQFDTINIRADVSPQWYSKYIYTWSPGKFLDDSTRSAVIFTAGDTTKLFLTVSTSAGCRGSDSSLIIVHPGNFDSSFADIDVCPGDSVQLIPNLYYKSAQEGVIATYLWRPGRYLSDSTATNPWLRAITSESFTTYGTSEWGCLDTFRFKVRVNPGAVIYLGDSVVLHTGETHQLNTQTNAAYFHWFPGVGISDTNASNPVLSPSINTKYIVRAETEAGCKVVDSINVRIDPNTIIKVPNAFTPGGGFNDKFFVIKRGTAKLNSFRIFNRWGVKVFETTDINEGWDGMYNNTPQPFGVYVYEVEAVGNNGKVFHQQGNVTLIR